MHWGNVAAIIYFLGALLLGAGVILVAAEEDYTPPLSVVTVLALSWPLLALATLGLWLLVVILGALARGRH